jgi:hypothetical protein
MSHTDYRLLIDRGRKAGLRTSELYTALASRQPDIHDPLDGQADGNGFVVERTPEGRPTYRPLPQTHR